MPKNKIITEVEKMNDRLKFRAWDKELNKMLIGHNQYGVDEPDFNKEYSSAGAFTRLWEALARFEESNRFKLMQSTGLKDSEGNLIFEGDVVEDIYHRKYSIKYQRSFCAYFLYPVDDEFNPMAIYPDISLKIIGNVYENSELLNESN